MAHDIADPTIYSPEERLLIAERKMRFFEHVANALASQIVRTAPDAQRAADELREQGKRIGAQELIGAAVLLDEHINIRRAVAQCLEGKTFDTVSNDGILARVR